LETYLEIRKVLHPQTERDASPLARASPDFLCSAYFLQQQSELQQSGEAQQDAAAAFTAPTKPSASTATNKIALILFIEVLLLG
jgi:hypothetical protein